MIDGKPIVSRRKGTLALMATSYGSCIILMIKGLVLVPFYLAHIKPELYGAWLGVGTIVSYFGLLDFGLNSVLVQRIASNYGKHQDERLGSILGTGLVAGVTYALLPGFLSLISSPWISGMVQIRGAESHELELAFIIAGAAASFMLIMYNFAAALAALQRQMVHGLILLGGDILGVMATIILLKAGYGLIALPLGTLIWALSSSLGDGLYLWWFVSRRLGRLKIGFVVFEFKDLSKQAAWQFGWRSAYTVAGESDNLIVAGLLEPGLSTVFTMTKRLSDFLSYLVKQFIGSFLPGLAHLHGEGDRVKFKRISLLLFKMAALLGICLIGPYLFINKDFVTIWVGPRFYGGELLTALFCLCAIFSILGTAFCNVIFSSGGIVTVARANMKEAFLRIGLAIGLVKLLGMRGVALAGVVSIIPTSFWIQAKSFMRLLELSRDGVASILKTIGLQIMIALIMGIALNALWHPRGIAEIIFLAGLYFALVCPLSIYIDGELRPIAAGILRGAFKKVLAWA